MNHEDPQRFLLRGVPPKTDAGMEKLYTMNPDCISCAGGTNVGRNLDVLNKYEDVACIVQNSGIIDLI